MKRTFSLVLCIAIIVVSTFVLHSAMPNENVTVEPSREPTATADGEQSAEPTENATPTASREPMATPSENPKPTATGESSVSPTENVTPTATPEPTPVPTATPTPTATPVTTATPTPTATPVPTPAPTATPVPTPTPTLEPELMYLYGLSEEALPGCNTKSREWSCGRFTRNDDGTVTVNWDKKQEALDIITQYNGFDRGSFDEKVIYLTLNIGFENDSVYKVLDILQEKDVKASFFVVCLSLYDDLAPMIQRIYDEGHIVGAHGYYHESMPFQTARRVVDSYTLCSEFLKNILGENYELKYVRPPAGAICERDLAIADNLGLKTVLWTASYNDYDDATMPTNEEALQYFDSCIFSGSVIQLHATSEQTARLLRKYIDKAQSLGYRFGLISEIG